MLKIICLKYILTGKIAKFLENQFDKGTEYIYNTPSEYRSMISDLFCEKDSSYKIVILGMLHKEIKKVFIGECRLLGDYKLIIKRSYDLINPYLEEFMSIFRDDTQEDLGNIVGYLFTKELKDSRIYNFLDHYTRYIAEEKGKKQIGLYHIISVDDISPLVKKIESNLSSIAQKSEYALRPYGCKKPEEVRSEFQRDRDRIVHSKAFRRLVDKAQIYTSSKGDHFRTRLTHTLEVNTLSRGIARILRLNEDLTEAIALGHDIGHTPFGHEGEREIHLIMSGEILLSRNMKSENFGGFKHNFQSLRTVNYLEERYCECEGLDLTYQVMEGMLKHTDIRKCKFEKPNEVNQCRSCQKVCYEIDQFLKLGDKTKLHLEYSFPTTIEGQVVAIADEIAQRSHDLDDGLACGVINIDVLEEDFRNNGMGELVQLIEEARILINKAKESRTIIDENDLIRGILVPKILQFLIFQLVEETSRSIEKYLNALAKEGKEFKDDPVVREKLVNFAPKDQQKVEYLKKIITQKVINSQEVNCFDAKSAYIIRKLFKAYYSNPRQLPDGVVSRIEREIAKYTTNVTNIRTGYKESVTQEIAIYQGNTEQGNIIENRIKQRCFMRCVADHIGGMTDEFANEQFRRLYIP